MDIKLFQTFLVVAKLGNITQAANQLCYAQPTITSQIHTLEEHFGVLLFKRVGKKLYITEAGRKFIIYAEKLVNNLIEAQEAMHEFDDNKHPISVGVATTAAIYLLSPIIREFQTRTKESVSIEVCPDIPSTIKGLLENKYDLVIVHENLNNNHFLQFDISFEKLAWVAQHDLVEENDNQLDIKRYPFITFKKGSVYRTKYDPYVKRRAINPFIEYSDSESIKRAVLDGLGIGVLPKVQVQQDITDGTLIEFEDVPELEFTVSIALQKNKKILPSLYTLLSIFSEETSENSTLRQFIQNNP